MKNRTIIGGGIVALTAAALGGIALAGNTGEREAGPRVVAEPIVATERGPVARAGGGAKITTFYVGELVVPLEGAGTVIGPRCPDREGKAISGGAATEEGIVVSYLSQIRPSNGSLKGDTYWVGVDDNSSDSENAGNGAIIEVHCAKGLKVRK